MLDQPIDQLIGSLVTKDLPISKNLWWRDLIFGGDNLFKDLFMYVSA